MKPIKIKPQRGLRGTVRMPGDKSISHRAAIAASLSSGKTRIRNFLFSDDCLATLEILAALGVKISIERRSSEVIIDSSGRFKKPKGALFARESGTTARILLGLLSAQDFSSKLTASSSLMKRPMRRVIEPLTLMGAHISGRNVGSDIFLPLHIFPARLTGICWKQKVASAQVKSAILLAGLYAKGETAVIEPEKTRDHTERCFEFFGADIRKKGKKISIRKSSLVSPKDIFVPGDISSAAFFMVAGLLCKGSDLLIKDVGINPTRAGVLEILKRMGANIRVTNRRKGFEPLADIHVKSSSLKAVTINCKEIPGVIDELPILMVAASKARGTTVIKGVRELRVKETDRIESMVSNLSKLGVNIRVKFLKENECLEIFGSNDFTGTNLLSFSDHRTAMSMVVAGISAVGVSELDDISCVSKSFPGFLPALKHLYAK